MQTLRLIVSVVAVAILCGPSSAGPTAPDDSGRYTMSQTEDGVVRLDTQTGAMALCRRKGETWACADMDDSQHTLMSEIDRLKVENKSLRDEVEQLEETLGLGNNQGSSSSPHAKLVLPSEEDVDKAFDYFERMLEKLQERMEKLKEKHGRKPDTAL